MQRKIPFLILLLLLFAGRSFGQFMLEPGIFLLPQKSWYHGSLTLENFSYAGGLNLALRFGEIHSLQISPMLSIQQAVYEHQPCEDMFPPCSPLIKTGYFFKFPVMYRATIQTNEVILIKLMAGPQISAYVYPSTFKQYYRPTLDAAAGFEICHHLGSGNWYLNYGLRFDRSLTQPIKAEVITPYGEPILPPGYKSRNTTLGLILGVDYLLERKHRRKRNQMHPGAGAG